MKTIVSNVTNCDKVPQFMSNTIVHYTTRKQTKQNCNLNVNLSHATASLFDSQTSNDNISRPICRKRETQDSISDNDLLSSPGYIEKSLHSSSEHSPSK